jgi:hypothetical protein
VGSNRGLSRRVVEIVQEDANDRQVEYDWRGSYAVMRVDILARIYPRLGETLGVYIYVSLDGVFFVPSHEETRMVICCGAIEALGTGRDSEIETNTDAAGWTGYFALACSQVVMREGHKYRSAWEC